MKNISVLTTVYAIASSMKKHIKVVALVCAFVLGMPTPSASAQTKEIFGIGPNPTATGSSAVDIYRIDLGTGPTVTDLGSSGVPSGHPTITNLAMSPNRVLYFMHPYEVNDLTGGHALYSATLNGTNTALVAAPTLITRLPTKGFQIIDGLTVGPDGKLYMTGYGKSEIYQYDVANNTFNITVRLLNPGTGVGPQFRSDLAFDPVSGNLIGLGIKPGTSDRTLFEIPGALALSSATDAYTWAYYGGGSSPWSTKNLLTELGGSPDGIAFDPTNGDLYMSGDAFGVYRYNRLTAVRGLLVAGNSIGWDLAFQTRTTPLGYPCPLTQGYWKNHASAWVPTSLTLGNVTYSKTQLLSILGNPSVGDASVILAKQLIAAKLNIASGSDPLPLGTTIQHADNLLIPGGTIPQNIATSSTTGQAMVGDGAILDKYNNGKVTPSCSERK